jgi:hypothetical protein
MYVPPPDGSNNVVIAHDNATHARMRKPLAAAFSAKAVTEQALIINKCKLGILASYVADLSSLICIRCRYRQLHLPDLCHGQR